jgi:hypothetical protein
MGMSAAQQAVYRERAVAQFERTTSVLRPTVTSDTISRGGTIYFLVAGSGGATAVTRGADGLIPPGDDSQVQVPVIFREDHYLIYRNGFNIFTAQGNQLDIMSAAGNAVVNRKMDQIIIQAIETGTVTLGTVTVMDKTTANKIAVKLRNAFVGETDDGNNIYALLSPAAFAELEDVTSFGNVNYSETGGMMQEGIPQLGRWKYWMGMNWGEHTGLTGVGTAACTCLAWHKNAIGHTISPTGLDAYIGREEAQDRSVVRHTVYHGAARLQNSGIVKFVHDDSALS